MLQLVSLFFFSLKFNNVKPDMSNLLHVLAPISLVCDCVANRVEKRSFEVHATLATIHMCPAFLFLDLLFK